MIEIKGIVSVVVACTVVFFSGIAHSDEIDNETGLIIAEYWETVRNTCTECHSAKSVIAQRGDRKTWTDVIRWMQATQGLQELDAKTEGEILQYLVSNYAPKSRGRRAPIPRLLMPRNLDKDEATKE
jgi:hypothetical protein